MNFKKMTFRAVALMLVVMLGLVGCSNQEETSANTGNGEAPAQETYALKLGHVFAEQSSQDLGAKKFAELAAEKTNNQVSIEIYPAAQLGGDTALAESLQQGQLDMAVINHGSLVGFDPRFELTSLLYLVSSYEEADELLYGDGAIATEVNKLIKDNGMHNLAFLENGFRAITNSSRPILKVEDLQGLKLRVPPSATLTQFFTDLGSLPTVIDFSELYTALQQKTVDGQDNGVLLTYESRLYEVQKYMTLLNHNYATSGVVVSNSVWDTLPSDIQAVLSEAAEEASVYQRELNRKSVDDQLAQMKEAGVEVTELSSEEMDRFRQAGQSLWRNFEDQIGKELLDHVLQVAEEAKNN